MWVTLSCNWVNTAVSVTRLSCFVDSLGPILLLTCYHGWRFCRTDIVEDHKRLITINNYFSQDWNDFNFAVRMINFNFAVRMINFNFAVRISSLRLGLPLILTNHTQGDRNIETVIRLAGAAYVYQNTCKRNARMGQDPRLGPY